jgi:hypothetical protein
MLFTSEFAADAMSVALLIGFLFGMWYRGRR